MVVNVVQLILDQLGLDVNNGNVDQMITIVILLR